jgi:type II secretory pathway pseudopilin PulG
VKILKMQESIGGQEGFTLIEVMIIIVMVSAFMAAIALPLLNSIRESDLPEIASTAYFLALEKTEELSDATYGSVVAETRSAVSGYEAYEREVVVTERGWDDTVTDLSNLPAGTGCKIIEVIVYHNSKIPNGIKMVTFRTIY